MLIKRSCIQIFSYIVLVLGLCHCTKAPESYLQVNQELASPYTMPASTYLDWAHQQEGNERQDNLIKAAGRMIHEGHWRKGLTILSQVKPRTLQQRNEKNILIAKTNLIRERPNTAIRQLASIQHIEQSPLYYQIQYHEMLAEAYQSSGKEMESVDERIKLERLLPDQASQENNQRSLWLSLMQLPIAELNTLAAESEAYSERKGWMELALIPHQNSYNASAMINRVQQWIEAFPDHPARRILPSSIHSIAEKMHNKPNQIAVLLPLSGSLAGPGKAIKEGFMSAHQSNGNEFQIRYYDTAEIPVDHLYQKALDDGADYVIGPLRKNNVSIIAGIYHPVPTLLLNDPDVAVKDNAYVLSLSPSSEARQVAAKARQNGNTKALVIAPSGSWGEEVTNAFMQQWNLNGGQVVDSLFYQQNDKMNQAIRNLLHVNQSIEREKRLKKVLGNKLQATPRRRQDFDMIFLLAYPSKARQIMPLLKYYFAGDVPVYATSAVYGGSVNTIKDRDLNGIIFCDMPWVFTHQTKNSNWPEQYNSYNRLFALGMDSYALTSQLNELLLFPTMGASDQSGILYFKEPQRIGRILKWGQFRDGMATPIEQIV